MTDIIQQFSDALAAAGYRLPKGRAIQADDKWHRLIFMDEKSSSGRYRLLQVESDFGIGGFGSDKDTAGFHRWHSKREGKPLSREERAALKARAEAYREEQEKALAKKHIRAGNLLTKAIKNLPAATENHQYLKNKGIGSGAIRWRQKGNELIVPMYLADGSLCNVQRIPANGWKGFFRGARVNGSCYPLGRFEDPRGLLLICEGFATGVTIHETTGLPVRVAFNTGNLMHLAKALRAKYPEARIAFCADNDLWTFKGNKKPAGVEAKKVEPADPRWEEWRLEGRLWNPGVEKAQAAAAEIGGATVIWPEFDDLFDKPTDFNDLRQRRGEDAVRARLAEALQEREQPAAVDDYEQWEADRATEGEGGCYEESQQRDPFENWPFKVLGHNDGQYYFFPRKSGQIFSSSAQGLGSIVNLFRLANLDWWNDHFGDSGKLSSRKVAELGANMLIERAHQVGVFKPSNIRGAGAWLDHGKPVIHCGAHLLVEGEKVAPHTFKSKFVYPLRTASFPAGAEPMGSKEASELREICGEISWESPLSGDLLAGWIVVAPVCGALEWRPHIWVEGESESGKTTVLERIIQPLLEGVSLRFDGGTTEAAIRQEMGVDALPVIYDEAEPENLKDRLIMDGLLLLARRASSGGRIGKGGAGGKGETYTIRSCFCFGGINPAIKQRADESRISRLVLKKATFAGADEFYKRLKQRIRSTLTRDYAHRLIARTIEHLPTLISNAEVFTDAAADVLTSRRAADQIGPMLAGLYLLTSTGPVDYDRAVEFIRKHDWTAHTAIAAQSDPERLITYISTATVRYFNQEISIGELIAKAHRAVANIGPHDKQDHRAGGFLRTLGIWVKEEGVAFANQSPPLDRILASTPWVSWSRPLKDIPGSMNMDPLKFATGLSGRSVMVPLRAFGLDREEPEADYSEMFSAANG